MMVQDVKLELEKDNTASRRMTSFTDNEKEYAEAFSEGINVMDKQMVLQYGRNAQKKVVHFSESALFSPPYHDYAEIEEDLSGLLKKLDAFEAKVRRIPHIRVAEFKPLYDRFSSLLRETARRTDIHHSSLLRHLSGMEKQYEKCMEMIREFDLYLYAGEVCLRRERAGRLQELKENAEKSGLLEDALLAEDYQNACLLFEKKLQDLSLSREIPLQMMAQIRLIQNTDALTAEGLQRLRMDTFSLFQNRMTLAMGMDQEETLNGMNEEVFAQACKDLRNALNALVQLEKKELAQQRTNLKTI